MLGNIKGANKMNISRNTLESLLRAIDKKGKDLTLEEVYAIDRAKTELKTNTFQLNSTRNKYHELQR